MKVRVVKAFHDEKQGGRVKFEGTIYETDIKRAAELTKSGHVVLLEPVKEYTLPDIELETKKAGRPKGLTTTKKKKSPPKTTKKSTK